METIEFIGTPEKLVYENRGNDYRIYGVYTDDKRIKMNQYGTSTVLGVCHELAIGVEYRFTVAEEDNRKNPDEKQYAIKSVKREIPSGEYATKSFLSEILTYNQVQSLMNAYPDIVDRIINNRLDDIDLNKTPHIKEYTFNVIKRKIEENFVYSELIADFGGLLNIETVKKLYDIYHSSTIIKDRMAHAPYKLLCNLSRVGFKTADSILMNMDREIKKQIKDGKKPKFQFAVGNLRTSLDRAYSACEYVLEQNESTGSTKMDLETFLTEVKTLAPESREHLKKILSDRRFIKVDKESKSVGLVELYKVEEEIASIIKDALDKSECSMTEEQIDETTNKFRNIGEFELSNEQTNGIKNLIKYNVSAIVGFAGSGKTASLKAILDYLDSLWTSYMLVAPTGRASKQMNYYTNKSTSTIHRGLGWNGDWKYNEDNKVPFSYVVIDEMSMCDARLFLAVLRAIDFNRTKLLIIGDGYQLPSVGAGNILHDLVQSDIVPKTMLTKVFRYGEGGVLTVATKIRNGDNFIESFGEPTICGKDRDFIFVPVEQEKILSYSTKVYKKLLEKGVKPEDILFLSAQNKGNYGTIVYNQFLQKIANKTESKKFVKLDEAVIKEGDLLLQYVNNYQAELYVEGSHFMEDNGSAFISNGDIGKVVKIDKYENGKKYVVINFEGIEIRYFEHELKKNVNLAYAISVHKSQGAGVDYVVAIAPKAHTFMLNSNLLYVAVTRTKKKCYLIGDPNVVKKSIKKKANFERDTWLQKLLKEGV